MLFLYASNTKMLFVLCGNLKNLILGVKNTRCTNSNIDLLFIDLYNLRIFLLVFSYFCTKVQFNITFLKIPSMTTNIITTVWTQKEQFESNNPSGHKLTMYSVADKENANTVGFGPKALMLSSLAGCSGLDVVSLLKKMRAEVANFSIEITAQLTDEHPKFYNKVKVDYHFTDANLQADKIEKAVNLSVTKYCGVMQMFRQFAKVETEIFLHTK